MNNKLALLINNNYNNNYIKMIVLGHNSFISIDSDDEREELIAAAGQCNVMRTATVATMNSEIGIRDGGDARPLEEARA